MRFSASDIAAALGFPDPSTICSNCPHDRAWHRRHIGHDEQGKKTSDENFECQHPDGRTKTGDCRCAEFIEPVEEY